MSYGQQESDATLKETQDWIQSKIISIWYVYYGTHKFQYEYENCDCIYIEKYSYYSKGEQKETNGPIYFNLKDINNVSLFKMTMGYGIELKGLIKNYYGDYIDKVTIEICQDGNTDEEDKKLAERMEKAFNHAIKLCGGNKKEKF